MTLQVRALVFLVGSMTSVSDLGFTPEVTALQPDFASSNLGFFAQLQVKAGQNTTEEKKRKKKQKPTAEVHCLHPCRCWKGTCQAGT